MSALVKGNIDSGILIKKTDYIYLDEVDNKEIVNPTATKPVVSIEWNPKQFYHCLLVAIDKCAVIIATGTGDTHASNITKGLFATSSSFANVNNIPDNKNIQWESLMCSKKCVSSKESNIEETNRFSPISSVGGMIGPVVSIRSRTEIKSVCWHKNGDYFVTISPKASLSSVFVHQVSLANSQHPFKSSKSGKVQCACFHPNKPFLFVASQQHVRVYNLVSKILVKSLRPSCRYISSMDVHPSGDHVVIGSFDRRLLWFDLDLGRTPYKTFKYHERAIRSVRFHKRYPLIASSSDDGTVHVFHCMVYSDLMRNPLIVPVKILKEYDNIENKSDLNKSGVLDIVFHPTQPWLFAARTDGKIFLYQDI